MQTFRLVLLLTLLLSSSHSNALALGFEDVAGMYVGNRTTTTADGIVRYDEIDVFDNNGFVYNYLYQDGKFVASTYGQLEIDEQGRFYFVSNSITIELHGNHLEVTAIWPDSVVHVVSHRTDQLPNWLR